MGALLLLRLPGERRRDHVRPRGRAPRLRRRGRAARGARRHHAALRRQAPSAKDRKRKERLSEAVGAAIDVLPPAAARGARRRARRASYLRSRGFDGDAARQFQLGWAPDEWDALSVHLQQEGFARDDIVDAGLAFVNRANKLQDQFRARLMFPIYDSRGEPAGFGGRALGDRWPEVQELARDAALPEEPVALRAQLGEGRDRRARARSSSARATPTSWRSRSPARPTRSPRAAPRSPTTTSRSSRTSPARSCSRTTPTPPARARPRSGTSGSRATRSRCRSPTCPPGATPADVWQDDPAALLGRGRAGRAVPPVPARPAARRRRPHHARGPGAGPPRPRPRSSPSTRTSSCATSTS